MKMLLVTGTLILALVAGCRIQVDKTKDGQDKNVKIDTPLGGLHVRAGNTSAADVGLPAYPGAQVTPDKDGDKSADVHFGFGEWQFRVKAVHYETTDPQENVVAFYRKALGRYGDVIECQGDQPVGSPAVTREGLSCSDDKGNSHVHVSDDSSLSLRAGSRHHQHIFAVDKNRTDGTRFSLVELQLPEGIDKGSKESN
ncbi:MAG: hypothetical protein JOZ33_14995 [Acidobacteriaceae bacterium]|nr:hypothetical protein [Acidobacteriaceae bacterium]